MTIIFTTAYKDISRNNWLHYYRTNESYYTNFLYGSAVAFQTKVLLQGFLKSFHASRDVVIKGTHSLINQNAKAAGLDYRIQ